MKLVNIIATALLIASAASGNALAKDAAHDHAPKHGGVVTELKSGDYELVVKTDSIKLYVSDHGKALDLSKASAKVTLLSGADKQEVMLAPAGDRLEAKGSFKAAAGTKAVALVTVNGKAATARFELK